MSKREIQEKELKAVLAKDIGAKNAVFSPDHIAELHALFSLYADPRQRRADPRELLLTASTLGLDTKYEFVFRLIQEVNDSAHGNALDFEGFLKELTARIVSSLPLRATPSPKRAGGPISRCWTWRARASSTFTTFATSTIS
jgi:Ca2+-binding EF-hand superfamily protein